jgi:hypothetical protein
LFIVPPAIPSLLDVVTTDLADTVHP